MQETLFDADSLLVHNRHPARYTDVLLPVMARMAAGATVILDPFGGTGKIFLLRHWLPQAKIHAVEIEAEWAALDSRMTHGSALALPWQAGYFDVVVTSPAYGNRMADHFVAGKPRAMKSYRDHLGHDLHKDNAGRLQWGEKYRTFHVAAWQEAKRVLQPVDAADTRTRLFILNIKDHFRDKAIQHVTDWHITALQALGFVLTEHVHVPTPSWRYGANAEARVGYESVIRFELPLASP